MVYINKLNIYFDTHLTYLYNTNEYFKDKVYNIDNINYSVRLFHGSGFSIAKDDSKLGILFDIILHYEYIDDSRFKKSKAINLKTVKKFVFNEQLSVINGLDNLIELESFEINNISQIEKLILKDNTDYYLKLQFGARSMCLYQINSKNNINSFLIECNKEITGTEEYRKKLFEKYNVKEIKGGNEN